MREDLERLRERSITKLDSKAALAHIGSLIDLSQDATYSTRSIIQNREGAVDVLAAIRKRFPWMADVRIPLAERAYLQMWPTSHQMIGRSRSRGFRSVVAPVPDEQEVVVMSEAKPAVHGLPSDNGGKDLGVFLPIANGGWILSRNKPEIDGSYDYNRTAALLADGAGFDFILAMAKYRGYGGETEHWNSALDSMMTMAALAEATQTVKVWGTVHTLLQNPAVVAKMVATLDQISQGRAGLNVVTGSYRDEFAAMGAWPDHLGHDERYDLAEEWIQIVKRLWSEPFVTANGQYFRLEDCRSDPKPATKPFLVCAGTSQKGMRFSGQEMDAIFLTGDTSEALAKTSRAAREAGAAMGRYLRTYAMMTVVLAPTDAEAEAMCGHYRDGFDIEALHGMMRAYGFLDSEIGKENDFVKKSRSSFMTPHVYGSPATVVERLTEVLENTDGLMLIFPDYFSGIPAFAEEVLPALRERFPGKLAAPSCV